MCSPNTWVVSPAMGATTSVPRGDELLPRGVGPAEPVAGREIPTIVDTQVLTKLDQQPARCYGMAAVTTFAKEAATAAFSTGSPSTVAVACYRVRRTGTPLAGRTEGPRRMGRGDTLSYGGAFNSRALPISITVVFSLHFARV